MSIVFRFQDERKKAGKPMKPWQARLLLGLARPMKIILGAMATIVVGQTLQHAVSPQAWAALTLGVIYGLGAAYYWVLEHQCVRDLAR